MHVLLTTDAIVSVSPSCRWEGRWGSECERHLPKVFQHKVDMCVFVLLACVEGSNAKQNQINPPEEWQWLAAVARPGDPCTHIGPHTQKDLVTVNFLYQPNWTLRGPALWLTVILGVGGRVFLENINTRIGELRAPSQMWLSTIWSTEGLIGTKR